MPRAARLRAARSTRLSPPNMIAPARTGSSPMIERIKVVLPAPLRPTRPTNEPSFTKRAASLTTVVPAMSTERSRTSSIAVATLSRDAAVKFGPNNIAADIGIGEHGTGRAVGDHASLVEGNDAASVAFDDFHVMLDKHDGGTGRPHSLGHKIH